MSNRDPNDFFTKVSSELSNPAINRDSMVFYSAASGRDLGPTPNQTPQDKSQARV